MHAQLTAEWLTKAFRSRGHLLPDEAITEVGLKPLGEGEGEFSELVLVMVKGVQGACKKLPRHLVAKFSPPNMSSLEMNGVFFPEGVQSLPRPLPATAPAVCLARPYRCIARRWPKARSPELRGRARCKPHPLLAGSRLALPQRTFTTTLASPRAGLCARRHCTWAT